MMNPPVMVSGLVSLWKGEGNARDSVGGNNGAATGTSYGTGLVGQAFHFAGAGDFVQAPAANLPTGAAPRSIDAWVRLDAPVAHEAFFAGYGQFGSYGQTFQLGATAQHVFFSQWGQALVGPALAIGTWYNVAATFDGATTTLYLDGQAVDSGALPVDTAANSSFYIGSPNDRFRQIVGDVDEVAVANQTLSPSLIQAIYLAGPAGIAIPAPAVSFAVAAPSTVTAGASFNVNIAALDGNGNFTTGFTGPVTLTGSDGQAMTPTSVNLVDGVGVASITLDAPETVTLSAGAGVIEGASNNITVTTTITVTSASDLVEHSGTSLRDAVALADEASAAGVSDTIVFDTAQRGGTTIFLNPGQGPLELSGTGAITINGSAAGVTVDGGGQSTVFTVNTGTTATLSDLTISHGFSGEGGGGIENDGTLTVSNSTFTGNDAGEGGGIENDGTLTVSDSTFSGNSADSYGGGIYAGGMTTLIGDILVGNTNSDHLADDLAGSGVDPSSSFNLVGGDGAGSLTDGQNGNRVGVTVAQAGLAPLGDNGDPTETFALLPGSLALGAGPIEATQTFDQRGVARPVGVPADAGAFQAVFPPNDIQVSASDAVTEEGQAVTLNGNFVDPRTSEMDIVTIAWGDGSADTTVVLAAGVRSFGAAHTYAAEGDYFPTVSVANSDGQTAAAPPEEQVLPVAFQDVFDLQGQPGQTVSGAVTDPVSGDVLQTVLTLAPGDAGVGEFLAAQLTSVILTPMPDALQGIASYDFRQHDLGPNDSVRVTLIIQGSLGPGAVPVLLYLDPRTHQEDVFRGDVHFIRGPDTLIVAVVFNDADTPRLIDLTTTVFTVAVSVPGATATAAVSASVASASPGATAAIQTATFQSASQLKLTLATTQLGQVSQSLSSLGDGGGGADRPSDAAGDDGLAQIVVEAVETVWHDGGEPFLRLWSGPPDMDPTLTPMAAPDAPPIPQAPELPHEKQSRGEAAEPPYLGCLVLFGPAAPDGAFEVGRSLPDDPEIAPAPFLLTVPLIGLGLGISGRRRRMRRRTRN